MIHEQGLIPHQLASAGMPFAVICRGVSMKTHFRLIFEGLDQRPHLRNLLSLFQKQLGLSEGAISNLLTSPPRVLWEVHTHRDAELIQTALTKMGCRTYLEPVVSDASYPFAITQKEQEAMNRELSKILRTRASLALFLVQVTAQESGSILPSMMGPFQESFAQHFRESDTVIAIDDSRIIILGFSTNGKGAERLRDKTNRVLGELLGDDILISTGYSLFPQEARSLAELIHLAEMKRKDGEGPAIPDAQISGSPKEPAVQVASMSKALERCFTKARGKIFKRLLSMDPQVLWLGLSQLPQTEQRGFLARFPFDSPLTPVLEQMIDTQSQPASDKAAEHHFEAIIHQMELEEGLEERKKTQAEVLSKLNRVESLPTLPSIAAHIFKIASNPNSSADDLTTIIVNDPPLTSKLLKIVNSAFYGFPQKIGAVKQAVAILGMDEIMDLSFGLAAANVFQVRAIEGLWDPKQLWHHSVCAAIITQDLCKRLKKYQRLGAFTAGLLHDFGKIFLTQNFPELYGQVHVNGTKQELPLFELEEEKFGLDHATIGEFLASHWNLPDALVQGIAFHHQPFSASSHSELAAVVGLADYLHYHAAMLSSPEDYTVLSPQLTFGHWSILTQLFKGLDTDELKKMTDNAVAILEDSQDLFAMLD